MRPVLLGADGPPLVILPTAQGDHRCLLPAFEPLAAHARLLLLPLRGERAHGAVPPFALADLVEDVEEAVRLAGFARFGLAGTSFGGVLALAYTLAHPERVERLVLNVTTARLRDHARTARFVQGCPVPLRAALFHLWALARCVPELLGLPPGELLGALRRVAAFARHRTPSPVLLRRIEILLELDLEARLPEVACPVLVVTGQGRRDGLVPPRSQRALLADVPGARQAVVPRTGHLGLLTRPDELRAVVEAFLLGSDEPAVHAPRSGGGAPGAAGHSRSSACSGGA